LNECIFVASTKGAASCKTMYGVAGIASDSPSPIQTSKERKVVPADGCPANGEGHAGRRCVADVKVMRSNMET
jgi:hypothetical protein